MIRADLEWCLKAVLPHVGRTPQTDWVGLAYRDGQSFAYATDRYTLGVARVSDGIDFTGWLPGKEATDLMRFVRPGKVAEQKEEVICARRPGELHIGFGDESEVYETIDVGQPLELMFELINRMRQSDAEWDEFVVQPKLVEKFAKAQREDFERLRIHPKRWDDRFGAAVVTIGSDFVGTIAGMEYDGIGPSILDDFLGVAA